MLAGLGFDPFFAAGICLLANTAPVAFGSIGIPVITLAGITGLPLADLSANVGRICAPVSLFIPAYLVVVMTGFRGSERRLGRRQRRAASVLRRRSFLYRTLSVRNSRISSARLPRWARWSCC